MALLNPAALLYALLIGVLLLVHFRRRPRRTYWVPDLRLWQAASAVREARPVLKRARIDRLLLVQAGVLGALVLALSQPVIRFMGAPARSAVIVMDRSASMNAREREGTRFDLARRHALALLAEIGGRDQVYLIDAGLRPAVRRYGGSEKAAIRSALEAMRPTQAAVDLDAALVLARTVAPAGERPEVFVFSDGTAHARAMEAATSGWARFVHAGESDDNVAITRLSVRASPMSAYDREVFAEVGNFSSRPWQGRLVMTLEGTVLMEQAVALGPGQTKAAAAPVPAGRNGVIRASVDAADDLGADNQAYAVTGPPEISVLLVTAGNMFLERALEVDTRFRTVVERPERWAPADGRKRFDAIVLDGLAPEGLPPANYLVLHYGQARSVVRGVDNLAVARPGHPITSFVNLDAIVIEEATPLAPPPSGVVVITGAGQPLVVASESGGFRTVDVGFDLRASNLPLTAALPVLLSNTLQWLTGGSGAPQDGLAAGTPIRWRVPEAAADEAVTARVTTPGGDAVDVPVNDGVAVFADTGEPGVYAVRVGPRTARFAVGLLDAAESNIRPAGGPDTGSPHLAARPQLSRPRQPIERALLLLALGLWALEWWSSAQEGRRRRSGAPQLS